MNPTNAYFAAMAARTPEAAEIAIINLIELALNEDPTLTPERAKEIQLINIGYFTGHLGSREEQRRVLNLYQTEHPIFGHYEHDVTPEKVLKAGMMLGELASEGGRLTAEAIAAARKIIEQP